MGNDKNIISELIRRQMSILGSDITMARVKNVIGIQVDPNGGVVSIDRDAQDVLSDLTNQFVELSGLIVKKTMESILAANNYNMPISQPQIPAAPPAPTIADRQVLTAERELEELNRTVNQ